MNAIEQLRGAISVLAEPPEGQTHHLRRIGIVASGNGDALTNIDELGLEFEDATYLISGLLEGSSITAAAGERIDRLNRYLLTLSGKEHSDFWTIGALSCDPRWEEVRKLARLCLKEMPNN